MTNDYERKSFWEEVPQKNKDTKRELNKQEKLKDEDYCHYSGLSSPMAYVIDDVDKK